MYKCSICKDNVQTILLFKKHIRMHHFNIFKLGKLVCGQNACPRIYSELNSFGKHLSYAHPQVKKSNIRNDVLETRDVSSSSSGMDSDVSQRSVPNESVPINGASVTENGASVTENETLDNQISRLGSLIQKSLCEVSARLYSNPQIPRNVVQTVMESIDCFTSSYNEAIIVLLNKFENKESITEDLFGFQNHTSLFDSEYKRFKFYEEKGTLIPAKEILLKTRCEYSPKSGYHSVNYSMHIIPINLVLQNFFSIDNILVETLKYIESLQNNDRVITNIMQGSAWQNKIRELHQSENVINLPIIVFYDDFEVNNPLGAHAGIQKIGGLYISLPFLPQKFASLLDSIFVLAFFHASDRVKFGNNVVFNKPIEELNLLSERGIPVNSAIFTGFLKFHVVALAGDNLGLNGCLGFVESFSALHYCRICRSNKAEIQTLFREDPSKLRTMTSYLDDLALDNSRETGIKSECAWFQLNGFKLFDNVSVDLLHDYLEGCCRYTMDFLLKYLVQESKIISFDALESRITRFDYGPDNSSKPNNSLVVDGSKIRFKTSASEMKTLVAYFGLIVGSIVNVNDPVWELYLLLRQILDKLLTHRIFPSNMELVSHLIEEFLERFTSVTKSSLKPKFHFLVHYPKMFLKFGPLVQVWTMRFEAKHQVSKIAARASKNRINITKTLALRNQLSLNYKFLKRSVPLCFSMGRKTELDPNSYLGLKVTKKCNQSLETLYFFTVPWFICDGIRLAVTDVVTVDICPNSCLPIFAQIKAIIVNSIDNTDIYLECEIFETQHFDAHFHAYLVNPNDDSSSIIFKKHELYTLVPNTLTKLTNKNFITLRYSID